MRTLIALALSTDTVLVASDAAVHGELAAGTLPAAAVDALVSHPW